MPRALPPVIRHPLYLRLEAPKVVPLVACVTQHHVVGPSPTPADTALHGSPLLEPLRVQVVVEDGQKVMRDVFQLFLDARHITPLQHRYSGALDLHRS